MSKESLFVQRNDLLDRDKICHVIAIRSCVLSTALQHWVAPQSPLQPATVTNLGGLVCSGGPREDTAYGYSKHGKGDTLPTGCHPKTDGVASRTRSRNMPTMPMGP